MSVEGLSSSLYFEDKEPFFKLPKQSVFKLHGQSSISKYNDSFCQQLLHRMKNIRKITHAVRDYVMLSNNYMPIINSIKNNSLRKTLKIKTEANFQVAQCSVCCFASMAMSGFSPVKWHVEHCI